jgi:aerobic carbon-monoxide dehydrogenase medium subunit
VKPAPFEYVRPATLDEALDLFATLGPGAKALAGGQSLVPAMNFRVAQPAVLVDLNGLSGMDGVESGSGGLRLGAMVRHRSLETNATVRAAAPLITEAMPLVAHAPIRTRGTLGGSLAHADPAAELPAVMIALDAAVEIASRTGRRTVPAAEFFTGLYATALDAGELVTGVAIPAQAAADGWAIEEVARRHGDFALAGAAVVVSLDSQQTIVRARVALFGVHERAIRATSAERALTARRPTSELLDEAAVAASESDADPASDIHASTAFRRHLTRIVVRRALERAVARARLEAQA